MNSLPTISIARTSAVVERGIADGFQIGAQIYASINGKTVINAAWGLARAGVPMKTDTLMLWLSSSKPIAAVAIGQLMERGRLDWDDPVAKHIPEFAVNGKDGVTIRHILTHSAGFRGAAINWTYDPWDSVIAQICATRLEPRWEPGKKAGYHPSGSWIILGEIIRRVDGRPFENYVRDEIFLPLAMNDSWIGMPTEHFRAYGDRIGLMHDTSRAQPVANFPADTEGGCAVCRPGSNGHGPIRELGFFYEMILRQGQPILSAQTVSALTARQRVGMYDHTFKHIMDWGLGFIVDNNQYGRDTVPYPFGPYCSPRTVGHGGSQSSVGFADSDHGLAAAIVFNGCPGEAKHAQRIRQVSAALYEDLGLA